MISPMNSRVLLRGVATSIAEAMADTPVVVLNGARQVGKTTLARTLAVPGRVAMVSLDDAAARQAASLDPRAFITRPVDTLVVDEAQLVPALFRAIKAEVDRDRRPGRFLLTGSSRLLAAPDMADALVGRVELIELWPFSQGELAGTPETFIDRLFDHPGQLLANGDISRADLFARVLAGGFPDAVQRPAARRRAWFASYVTTVCQRVVRQLADIERLAEIPRLLKLCAARTGTELNAANLADAMAIPARTASAYLAHLANAFLIQLVPAWSTNLSAKVVRRPKLLLADSGLAAHLMGVTSTTLDGSSAAAGQLLETFVAMELRKQIGWSLARPSIWHFRDRSGVEVDLLLEHGDGRIVGIEVKATSSPKSADFKGLRFLAERLGDRFHFGCLLTAAPEATPFGPKLAALPVSALWSAPQAMVRRARRQRR